MDVPAPAGAGVAAAAALAPPGAVVVPVAVAAAQPAAGPAPANWTKLRVRWAQALVVLGLAAAALAMFAFSSPTAQAGASCAPTAEEAADLRAVAEDLLMAAAGQVLAAMTAVLWPCRLFTVFATLLGWLTGFCAGDVLWQLVACHGHVHGDRLASYWILVCVFFVAFTIGFRLSIRGLCACLDQW